jgi:glycosyltransferase involved in cell wall biosynthesis
MKDNGSCDRERTMSNILIVLPGLGAGGTEHVVSGLANHWNSIGHHVTLVTLESPEAQPYYELHGKISVRRLGLPPYRYTKLRAGTAVLRRLFLFRKVMKDVNPDVIISFLTRTNVLTLLAVSGLNISVVVSERNNPELQPFGPIWIGLRKILYPRAFGLVTMTRGSLEYFPKRMRRRGWVIANVVDLPSGWQRKRGHYTLAAVGRLTHQKGFDLLLEAFAKIAQQFPEWNLTIWGDGEDRAKLEALRERLQLVDRVKMPGITSKPGIWIETADVFVLSSRYEGWGIVLLEAMAAELPVVSFNCEWGPGTMITDGHDGLLVPVGDVDGLAGALTKVLGDEELRNRLAQNAADTAQRYTPDRIMADWDGVLEAALASLPVMRTR